VGKGATRGLGMSYVFRLRTRIKCRLEGQFPVPLKIEGFPAIEVSYEAESQTCAVDQAVNCPGDAGKKSDGGRYTFIARGFADEATALTAGRKFADLLLAIGATKHLGIDVGFERASLQFSAAVIEAVKEAAGVDLKGDMIGLMAYPDGSVGILRMEGNLSTARPLEQFVAELKALASAAPQMSERQRNCAALLNDSNYATQDEAIFVLLISAVEALCDQGDLPQDYVSAVEQLEDLLNGMAIETSARDSLATVLKFAKKHSIRQSYMNKFRKLLSEEKARNFDELYQLRSKFVHDGKGRGELRGKIGLARALSVDLFVADLGVKVP